MLYHQTPSKSTSRFYTGSTRSISLVLLLSVMLQGLSSCGVWDYTGYPSARLSNDAVLTKETTLYFHLTEHAYYTVDDVVTSALIWDDQFAALSDGPSPRAGRIDRNIIDVAYKEIENIIRTNAFIRETRMVPYPPVSGTYCLVDLIWKADYTAVNTAALLPLYDASGFILEYSIFVDRHLTRLIGE